MPEVGNTFAELQHVAQSLLQTHTPAKSWQLLCRDYLSPSQDSGWHWQLYQCIFAKELAETGAAAAVYPTAQTLTHANISRYIKRYGFTDYQQAHQDAYQNYANFWQRVIDDILHIPFNTPPRAICEQTDKLEHMHWLPQARFNIADACLQAPPDQCAIREQLSDGSLRDISYGELQGLVNQVANSLSHLNLATGARIAIIMPLHSMAAAFYLGVIKAGFTVVCIAESFSSEAIADRLRIAKADLIIIQDAIYRAGKRLSLYDKLLNINAAPALVYSETTASVLRPEDKTWHSVKSDNIDFTAAALAASHCISILFSSGTTGDPKAIPWTQTCPIKAASDAYFHCDMTPQDVLCWPTSLGWMMGPWEIFAALMNRSCLALSPLAPNTRLFCQFVSDARVTVLGIVPSLLRTWRKQAYLEHINLSHIKLFASTGECSNIEDMFYLMSRSHFKPVIEYCGGTEIAGAYITSTIIQDNAPACSTTPAMGLNFFILNHDNKPDTKGEVAIQVPSLGLSQHLLNRDHHQVYFADMPTGPLGEVLRRHGDEIMRLGQFYRTLGRVDDTMNLGGIKVSSAEIERVVSQHPKVYETAAVAISPNNGPSQLIIFTVLNLDAKAVDIASLQQAMQLLIKQDLNPLFKIDRVIITEKLPRTASNKIMRRTLRDEFMARV